MSESDKKNKALFMSTTFKWEESIISHQLMVGVQSKEKKKTNYKRVKQLFYESGLEPM